MARPRQFDEEAVLSSATDVFWRQGYEATTTDDLEAATGLKRGSLYNAFGDKRGVYLAALDYYARVHMGEAISIVKSRDSAAKSVRALLQFVIDQAGSKNNRRGCLLCDAGIERAPHDAEVADRVRRSNDRLSRALGEAIAAGDQGRSAEDVTSEADRLVATYMGLRMFAKIGYSKEKLRAIADRVAEQMVADP